MPYLPQSEKEKIFSGKDIHVHVDSEHSIDREAIKKEFFANEKKYTFTHFICQRWENIYLNINHIPTVKPLLHFVLDTAIEIYRRELKPHETLVIPHDLLGYEKNEFWFNAAQPGESTGVHNHNGKAFLSGVFYLQVPKGSGNIHFKLEDRKEFAIEAEEGKLILFPAEFDHYVPENCSNEVRISLAFNLYKLPLVSVEVK
ncbi:MAG: putative 2OG-Fe(II) oxygenase [Candidatus Marinimicrobia bacterium]|jgi:hypothetical protein|nr:putative 2OG-Fe(II) oxygenase [Candidatus Neomarinimicrobiota bacterium]